MRKRIFILSALLFSAITFSSAQIIFQKNYGGAFADLGQSVSLTNDGGYIIAGSTQSFGTGAYDFYLIRTNSNGDTLWTSVIGTSPSVTDAAFSAKQTTDGGFIITGEKLDGGTSSEDMYLIKTDSAGNPLWTKTYGGYNDQVGYSVEQTTDGGFIIGGDYRGLISSDFNAFLVKTNAIGDTLWSRVIGGTNDEHGYSAIQTSDGGYIITGSTNSFGIVNQDVLLLKTNSTGNLLWTKTFGGSGYDIGYSVQQLNDGGFIIGGTTTSFAPAGFSKLYLIRTDSIGDTLWTKIYTAGIGTNIVANSIRQTATGDFILAGNIDGIGAGGYDIYLIKTNGSGNLTWSKTYGGTSGDFGKSVKETTDGGFIIAGYTQNFGVGGDDIYLIKTDSMGNSGCNEANVSTVESSPATQVGNYTASVASLGVIAAPATLLQRGGTVTVLCVGYTGIREESVLNSMIVAPNPSARNFTITFANSIIEGKVQIFNAYGAKVFEENIHLKTKMEINTKNISKGIYFVRVYDGAKYYFEKIIIEQD